MRKDFHWLWVLVIPMIVVLPIVAPEGGNVLLLMTVPFVKAGEILRGLSLSGDMGNLVAIGLYLMVCALPLWLIRRDSGMLENGLLIVASILMLRVMWLMINPGQMTAYMRNDLGMTIHAGAVYSVMITWGLLKLLRSADRTVQERIYSALRIFLMICAVQFVMEGLGFGFSAFREKFNAVHAGNTALSDSQLMPTVLFMSLEYCLKVVEHLMIAWILMLGVKLLEKLEEDPYSEDCQKMAQVIFSWCKKAIPFAAVSNMLLNVGQVLMAPILVNVSMELRMPVLSLAVTFSVMALTRLLAQGKAIKDDNDLFI